MKQFKITDVNELETVLFALNQYKKNLEIKVKDKGMDAESAMELDNTEVLIDKICQHLNN